MARHDGYFDFIYEYTSMDILKCIFMVAQLKLNFSHFRINCFRQVVILNGVHSYEALLHIETGRI